MDTFSLYAPIGLLGVGGAIVVFFIRSLLHWVRGKHGGAQIGNLWFTMSDFLSQIWLVFAVGLLGTLLLMSKQYNQNFILTYWEIALLLAVLAGGLAYLAKSVYLQLLAIGLAVVWWFGQAADFGNGQYLPVVVGMGCIAVLLALLGRLTIAPRYARFNLTFQGIGLAGLCLYFFILSTNSGLQIIDGSRMLRSDPLNMYAYALGMVMLVYLATGFAFYKAVQKNVLNQIERVMYGVALVVPAFVGAWLLSGSALFTNTYGVADSLTGSLTATGLGVAALLNLTLLGLLLGLIWLGYCTHREVCVNVGAGLVFLFILVKYFDWFFLYLDKSVFFLVAGALLVGLGWTMERGRRTVVRAMSEGGAV